MTLCELEVATRDTVDRLVHHHTWAHHVPDGLAGLPIPMVCGEVVAGGPKGWRLPCCPLCALVMEQDGHTCRVGGA